MLFRSVQLPIVASYGSLALLSRVNKRAAAKKDLLGLMVHEPHISLRALSTLTMPVLVIAGRRDMIKESHTRAIAAAIPRARLVILEGDHFVAAKNSAAFNAQVLHFLQEGR